MHTQVLSLHHLLFIMPVYVNLLTRCDSTYIYTYNTGIAVAPIILISVREPKRTKNLKVEEKQDQEDKPSFVSRLVQLIKTFLYPGMFMLCIAGGIRNAGGYVWAYNTELFFQAQDLTNAQINHFMSWIPLVGGSLGAIFGGFISDLLVKNRSTYVRIWVLIVSQVSIFKKVKREGREKGREKEREIDQRSLT